MDPLHLTADDIDELTGLMNKLLPNLDKKIEGGFDNWCETVNHVNVIQVAVFDTKTLCIIVKELNEVNQKRVKEKKFKIIVRAAAGCTKDSQSQDRIGAFSKLSSDLQYETSFSLSPCVEAHVILRLVGKEFDNITIKEGELVTVGCNVQIGQLEAVLYQSNPKLSLPVSPLIPWVTLVGIVANAGHGTGLNQPAMAGLVESITMVKPNGELKTIKKDDADFDVINGAHLGMFGLVTEVTIKCIPACKLKATKYAWSINEFFRQVNEEKLYEKNEYVSVMYIPTYFEPKLEKTYFNVQVVVANQVQNDTPNVHWSEEEQLHDDKEQVKQMEVFHGLHVSFILEHKPSLVPLAMRAIAALEVGLIHVSPIDITGPFYQVAHYQRQYPRNLDDIDFLFPVKEPKQMLGPLDKIITTLEKYCSQGHYPVTDAIYIRMFKGTNGGLSTSPHQPDEYTAAIDIVTDPKTPYYQDLPNTFKEEILQYFMDPSNNLNAKPHWGKTLPKDINYATLYGNNFKQFMDVAEKWYNDVGCTFATSIFMNPFFERVFNITVGEPIRQPQLKKLDVNMPQSVAFVSAIDKTKMVNGGEEEQLRECVNKLERELKKRHYIPPSETLLLAMPLADDNSQTGEHNLPYISLFCRAGDAAGYREQQNEIQIRANQFLQEAEKAVEDAPAKNEAGIITSNTQVI